MTSKKTLSGTALLAIAIAMPAVAQTSTSVAGASNDSNTIVVTARKRSEDIQTVPISIVSLSAAELTKRSINSLADLSNSTPGLAINSIAGGALLTIYIRGQAPANTNSDLNTEANVGVFIDGIYQTSRNTVDIISVLDVAQLDVAKGPQSALYGRSTFAGALGIFTAAPSRQLGGRVEGTVGTNADYRMRGSVSGPIVDGKLFGRLSAGYLTFGGTAQNLTTPNNNVGGYKKYAISGSLELDLGQFNARLNGFATHSESEVSGIRLPLLSEYNCGTTDAATGARTLLCGPLVSDKINDVSADMPDTTFSTQQVSLDLKYKFDPFTLVSVTGLTQSKNRTYNDYDGSGRGISLGVCQINTVSVPAVPCAGFGLQPYTRVININAHTSGREQVRTFSQEVRIQSPDNSKFQWMLGGFYFNSRIPTSFNPGVNVYPLNGATIGANERLIQVLANNPPGFGPADGTNSNNQFLAGPNIFRASGDTIGSTITQSIFGSLGYDFGQVRVSAEGRYNIDKKTSQLNAAAGGVPVIIDGPNTNLSFPNIGVVQRATFKSFTPRFSIDYRPTDNVFLYATAAKGVRSGGFNNQSVAAAVLPSEIAYKEEENWTYEVGLKSKLLDNRLLLNLAVYKVDWKNMQIAVFSENSAATGLPVAIITNASSYKIEGIEGTIEARPNDIFGFGGSFNFTNPRFGAGSYDTARRANCITGTGVTAVALAPCSVTTITAANGTVIAVPNLEGKRTARSVKASWNLHATATVPVGNDWEATGRVDVNYTGDAFIDNINSTFIPSRTLTNLRLSVSNDKYSIAIFANNLFDKVYAQNAIVQPRIGIPFFIRVPEAIQGERRRIGLTAAAKF